MISESIIKKIQPLVFSQMYFFHQGLSFNKKYMEHLLFLGTKYTINSTIFVFEFKIHSFSI